MNTSEATPPAGVPKRFRRLKWNEVVSRGDFVGDEVQGFEPWEGPAGFRADTFVKPIYRQAKTVGPQPKKSMWRAESKARETRKAPTITADSELAGGGRRGVRVRKQVYELTLHDLNTFPVWEFRLDGEGEEGRDESTVRPYAASGPLDPADRMFVVRAVFTLADGSKLQGYLTPPTPGNATIGALQPIIITERGQVRFWCGTAAPDAKRLAHSYELLGKAAQHVFPVQFESDVELAGGVVRGSVPGFLVLENFQTRSTRTVI